MAAIATAMIRPLEAPLLPTPAAWIDGVGDGALALEDALGDADFDGRGFLDWVGVGVGVGLGRCDGCGAITITAPVMPWWIVHW